MDLFTLRGLALTAALAAALTALALGNLLHIAVEARRAPPAERAEARRVGLGDALLIRALLVFLAAMAIESAPEPLFSARTPGLVEVSIGAEALLLTAGGALALGLSARDAAQTLLIQHVARDVARRGQMSKAGARLRILALNLAYGAASAGILLALSGVFAVMMVATVICAAAMIALAERAPALIGAWRVAVAYALFITLLAGGYALASGAAAAQLRLFGVEIEPIAASTFWFLAAAVAAAGAALRPYQKKLLAAKKAEIDRGV